MKQLVLGILAHVDAGKTTLSEALLYRTGAIRDLGRVDHKNAHLDTHALERARGITIFSRQARLPLGDTAVTLLDTPGHVDFSAEMERTLQVLDYAVLVISGTDGVQAHTETLWQLLRRYRVPVFVFVTKMDLPGADRAALMADLRAHLSGACVDFTDHDPEQIALCDEAALEQYLDTGALPDETVRALIRSRKLFPCLFGSGLKLTGVDAFLAALERYAAPPEYPAEFGARVFKIMRDAQGNRLTCLKVTGGQLRVRAPLTYFPRGADAPVQEKVNAIRLYSGEKFDAAETVPAGGVCAVQGLTQTYPGQGLGSAAASMPPSLEQNLCRGRSGRGGGRKSSDSGAGADLPHRTAAGRGRARVSAAPAPARGGGPAAAHRLGRGAARDPCPAHGHGADRGAQEPHPRAVRRGRAGP